MNTPKTSAFGLPAQKGLYNPAFEHDACGVGVITQINGDRSHKLVRDGLSILINLEHRGAAGSDPLAGDGAGIMTQVPHQFLVAQMSKVGIELPVLGEYGVGMVFLPPEKQAREACKRIFEQVIQEEGQSLIGWRQVPSNNTCLSPAMLDMEPSVWQVFVRSNVGDFEAFERKLYVIRRQAEKRVQSAELLQSHFFYVCSLSHRTIVYKGMFLAYQLNEYYPDLSDPDFTSAIALVHQRYSTNTFPTWSLAQPFRFIAHNGEINTLRGNINWTKARESLYASSYFGEDIHKLTPVIQEGGSDSATFDNVFELLVATGRSMEHAFAMMVPEAWENQKQLDKELLGFYEYHAALIEPWDGPAAMIFTDGRYVVGGLDRNGLRPVRYVETLDGYFIMASEVGVLDVEVNNTKEKGRLGPGRMVLIDTEEGILIHNEELKSTLARQKPYARWVEENKIYRDQLPEPGTAAQPTFEQLRLYQRIFFYSFEELNRLIKPMAIKGEETTYSMGNDTPLAVLSDHPKSLFNYFKQLFAQVTNPAIDSIREELVMSLKSNIGGSSNILEESPVLCKMLEVPHPILTNAELEQFKQMDYYGFRSKVVHMGFPLDTMSLEQAIEEMCAQAEKAVDEGYRLLVLSDRCVNKTIAPIPSLLAVGAVHHSLIRKNKRGKIGLIIESGEVREVHHFAMLIGYGAGAINPYLAFETITQMEVNQELPTDLDSQQGHRNYISAVKKGLMKIFSKMGISTLASYQGAQIFEAVGLNSELIDRYFCGTNSVVEGIGLKELEEEVTLRHRRAYAPEARNFHKVMTAGEYHWRAQGEYHGYNPITINLLQQCTTRGDYQLFKKFTHHVDFQAHPQSLRHLFDLDLQPSLSIPVDQVESEDAICARFVSGAMSIGSISREAHEALAIAMNRIGGRSNSGEGGEDPTRFTQDANGDSRRSKIKQVASGRFGVTSHYLTNADEIQIKISQGAKPGEGGQLPGFKVDEYIGKIRHTIPGVTLISPPPHHDIYSIEDLAQLIFDLKNSNDKADINVKLVSESGVGTVAAGVSKALADSVTIAGHDGGTGASPATSIKHAGLPWEIGLAEVQQTLVVNNLRGQIRVQVDGQLKTGRDVVIAALLGAEEFGFATSTLVILGCIMMRKCHLNTCPVGVATQDVELRSKFKGNPDHVIHFFRFLARETREYMAQLGFRTFEEMIGQVERLKTRNAINHWKAKGLDFSRLFVKQTSREGAYRALSKPPKNLEHILDQQLIALAKPALEKGTAVSFPMEIRNRNRTTGTMLGSEITRAFGAEGLPEDTIHITFTGTAGQSFGAFIPQGLTLDLKGDANDYVGKGLSGGKIIISTPEGSKWKASSNMIVGNTVLYGATGGQAFFNGKAGERFGVRNSGATAVVEGVGDHGCEYMTGGLVVVLGETGKNFAAGMSGGVAFVYDQYQNFKKRCNVSMVDIERINSPEDAQLLKGLVEKHFQYTHSKRAKTLLDNWKNTFEDFVMVIPLEYRKVLALTSKIKAS
ncbi:MAG: glutamate synthase subunit alpha [Candidatus Lambdaproteobacteria bacterium RIFOXYD1_FULL_56_27]|uniref:Glutamate synthase [NADPH] large chain n=1 Tax=Candidatus Lambdaproteobacteria bacterium RIFOXYD2_FULL_56_26 TaxID=1817773 RepID=A0A1F6H3I3_9PROT|nr:MAG: glutamate synthase subunit alpha [Candidatus Lambdaproteobacteria bacterium RIFOXYC1_FULL_56_13]OGH04948.1 MAG: glutamate synthase subunit alpha [Candidatus Lambdaproteobacteria bacterium RIFOXYD2_FULL_56_26]OGH09413.1 MAG: glutamate synthase subunit alpha [Candidatus Lambdaproteobacteria bacterium RIFOXYD1_FULL_56_27]